MPDQHTIDTSKNYVGKILKLIYLHDDQEHFRVGIVYQQKKAGEHLRFTMLLTNGQEWQQPYTTGRNANGLYLKPCLITKISSVHMDADLRKALKDLCNAKLEQEAFLKRFQSEKLNYERKVAQAQGLVKELSGELSWDDFRRSVETLFCEKYPSTGGYDSSAYFELDTLSEKAVTMRHVKEVEKWAEPEWYPFLSRRYDDSYTISESHPRYKSFCESHAAPVIPALKDYCVDTCAHIGDKRHLTVARNYTFQLTHGLSRQSLRDIGAILDGTRSPAKKPLDAQISGANSKKGVNSPNKEMSRPPKDKAR